MSMLTRVTLAAVPALRRGATVLPRAVSAIPTAPVKTTQEIERPNPLISAHTNPLISAERSMDSIRNLHTSALRLSPEQHQKSTIPADQLCSQESLKKSLSPEDLVKWNTFQKEGVVYVVHEGHCANVHIDEAERLGLNVVLVSKKEECDAEKRPHVVRKIVLKDGDFNNLDGIYGQIEEDVSDNSVSVARVCHGWGYSSEKYLQGHANSVAEKTGIDFKCPSNSQEVIDGISDKDNFAKTCRRLEVPTIPDFEDTMGYVFNDNAGALFKFAEKLAASSGESIVTLYLKHPSTGGGRGIVPIEIDVNQLTDREYRKEKTSEIDVGVASCHAEGKPFLEQGEDKKNLVVQKGINDAYHIEVQIIDGEVFGYNPLRECSAQRRGQKERESTPGDVLSSDRIAEIKRYAETIAQADFDGKRLEGANTLEFLVPTNGQEKPYALEINNRVQVENLVTKFANARGVIGTVLMNSLGIKAASFEPANREVTHIRLKGLAGENARILSTQEDIQGYMDKQFGKDVVKYYQAANSIRTKDSDSQFGALVISKDKVNPQFDLDVFDAFTEVFKSEDFIMPNRETRGRLVEYLGGNFPIVGINAIPASPTQQDKELAGVTASLEKLLNGQLERGQKATSVDTIAILKNMKAIAKEIQETFPKNDSVNQLQSKGFNDWVKSLPPVSAEITTRDLLQSYYAHVTHPEVTELIHAVEDHLPKEFTCTEPAGTNGAGPQVASSILGMDPNEQMKKTSLVSKGLERGEYMNALQKSSPVERAAQKKLLTALEKETYGTFEHKGKEYSGRFTTCFDASNNIDVIAKMVVEDIRWGRPSVQTLSWNPEMKIEEVRSFWTESFNAYKREQDVYRKQDISIPDPFGIYLKCPSPTTLYDAKTANMILTVANEEYVKVFPPTEEEPQGIKLAFKHVHQDPSSSHQTTEDIKLISRLRDSEKYGTKYVLSTAFESTDAVSSSHPNASEIFKALGGEGDLSPFEDFYSKLGLLYTSFDNTSAITPDDPEFDAPGGAAATGANDVAAKQKQYPENEALKLATYEKASDVGKQVFDFTTLVTPNSQFALLSGLEIIRIYGKIKDKKLDVAATVVAAVEAITDRHFECDFPPPVIEALQYNNSDNRHFPMPENRESNVEGYLDQHKLPSKSRDVEVVMDEAEVDEYLRQMSDTFESEKSMKATNAALLDKIRFGGSSFYDRPETQALGVGREGIDPAVFFNPHILSREQLLEYPFEGGWKVGSLNDGPDNLSFIVKVERHGVEQVLTVPNHEGIRDYIQTLVGKDLTKTLAEERSIKAGSYDLLAGGKITCMLPPGTIITVRKDERGNKTFSLANSEGEEVISPFDNPSQVVEALIMKMAMSQGFDYLEPGRWKFNVSPYVQGCFESGDAVHDTLRGHEALPFYFEPLDDGQPKIGNGASRVSASIKGFGQRRDYSTILKVQESSSPTLGSMVSSSVNYMKDTLGRALGEILGK
ncbi:hypothetical protein DID78_00985 [Candidatus Marinamargulisbacteria bacterium SCGC AG-343-D04]|nr:hypothetical protein DID78_00985 [Candidatus Marinamargulisbacteria bacterium SCGC AG-343-D04]